MVTPSIHVDTPHVTPAPHFPPDFIAAVTRAVEGRSARKYGDELQFRCPLPGHEDKNPSAVWNEEKAVWRCYRCHSEGEGGGALQLADLLGVARPDFKPKSNGPRMIVATYDYTRDGELLFQVVRYEPKTFRQRRPVDGGWEWNLRGVEPVLYRHEDLEAADPVEWVYLCAGEKDADRLRSLGRIATTNPMGEGKWRESYTETLRGRRVVVLEDNDPPGRKHAHHVAAALSPVCSEVKVISFPDLPDKGDVSDYLDAGHSVDDLDALRDAAPEWTPPVEPVPETPAPLPTTDNETPSFPATDTGNAERLVHRHGANLRYVGLHKAWLVWTGTHWERDETGRVAQLTKDAVRMIKEEAANLSGEEYLKLSKWAHASESATRRAAMELLARSEPGIPARPGDFDQAPWLLTVANGTLDLRTGELRPHSRADMITRYSPIEYRPDAECPLFLEWLHEIMLGRADLVTFLQRAAGYSLTGNVSERVVFILHGGGRNGKTTLLETLSRILGDYAGTAPAEMLLAKRETGIPNDLARLPGRRFVSATETGEGRRLDEVKVKAISGGDTIQARFLHGEWFDFRPSFKIWLGTNHKPEIRGTDNAIWDRIRLIPFDYRVTDDLKIPDLADRFIRDEAAGILAWMVQGCLAWQRDGLGAPAEVMHATSQYRQEMDPLASWIEDRCEISEDATESARALYTSYSTYCEQAGETPLKQRTFGTRLTERGCGSGKSGGTRYRTGIRLLTLEEREKRGEIRPSLENVGHIVSHQKAYNHAGNGQDSSNVGHIRTKFQGYSGCDLASRGNPETNVPYAPYVPTEDGKVAF